MAIHVRLLAKGLTGLGVIATALSVGIVKKDDIYHHFYPNDNRELNKKIRDLGITACQLENGQSKTQECSLDANKIKAIKFDGKAGESLTPDNASLTLTIEKGYDTNDFPEGLRFSFTNSSESDVTIGSGTNQITFKSGITYDYKIKTEGEGDKITTLAKAINLPNLVNEVGLSCNSNGGSSDITECSFSSGINVWKNENNYLTGGGTDPSAQKKIKVDKDSSGYRQGIKFYVEEEITLKTNSISHPQDYPLNKETSYEIDIREATIYSGQSQRKEKKWFLIDKSTAKLNEKIKALGITDCDLVEGKSKTSECSLDANKIKAIKFDGKTEDTLNPENASLTLTIERDHPGTEFPWGLRFNFTNSNNSDVTIGSSNNTITFKAGFIYDYKMKTDGTQLEKAWTIATLGAKVGLTCSDDAATECTLKTTGINVWKDETDYITGATQSESDKKITITKDQPDYFEGFKFTLKDDDEEINLQGGKKKKDNEGISKLTKTNMSYGIDVKDIGGIKTWFLVEKSAPQESQ